MMNPTSRLASLLASTPRGPASKPTQTQPLEPVAQAIAAIKQAIPREPEPDDKQMLSEALALLQQVQQKNMSEQNG